jgi:hypothetical protein
LIADHTIEGYCVCRCGALVPDVTAAVTGRRCLECAAAVAGPTKMVEVLNRGRRTQLPARPAAKMRPKTGSKGKRDTARRAEAAKKSALRRLRMVYPDIYDMLYDEERVAVGLPPVFRPATTYSVSGHYDPSIDSEPNT